MPVARGDSAGFGSLIRHARGFGSLPLACSCLPELRAGSCIKDSTLRSCLNSFTTGVATHATLVQEALFSMIEFNYPMLVRWAL